MRIRTKNRGAIYKQNHRPIGTNRLRFRLKSDEKTIEEEMSRIDEIDRLETVLRSFWNRFRMDSAFSFVVLFEVSMEGLNSALGLRFGLSRSPRGNI